MPGKTTFTATTHGLSLGALLAENRMPMNNFAITSTKAYRDVMKASKQRIDRPRLSSEQDAKASDFEALAAQYRTRNEQTFIELFFLQVTHRSRNVLVNDNDQNDAEHLVWKERTFADDGMDMNICQPFQRNSLPKVSTTDDRSKQKLLDSLPRIKNPVPDRCYGLTENSFSQEELSINRLLQKFTGISCGIYHPSVVIEFGLKKPIEELEGQCARGGAALVNAVRSLRSTAGESVMADGADQDSTIYSFAITGHIAYLHVNWAFVEAGNITFHMHLVKEYSLRTGPTIMQMGAALENLLDWTVGERQTWIKGLLGKIAAKDNLVPGPTPVAMESTVDGSSIVVVETDDAGEDDDNDALAAPAPVGGTSNKKRKHDALMR